ncbi:PsbP domain-containing protein 4, chloroplastic [Linum perenne]
MFVSQYGPTFRFIGLLKRQGPANCGRHDKPRVSSSAAAVIFCFHLNKFPPIPFCTTQKSSQRSPPITFDSSSFLQSPNQQSGKFKMGTSLFTIPSFSPGPCSAGHRRRLAPRAQSATHQTQRAKETISSGDGFVGTRRSVLGTGACLLWSAALGNGREGIAVVKQGLLAGRIPGLSEPDEQGWRTYRRPDEKSGGHGVGWSPIIPYAFSVPQEWEEVPVSIADLGGTEIDLRFANSKEGRAFVIVAPVLRFADSKFHPDVHQITNISGHKV